MGQKFHGTTIKFLQNHTVYCIANYFHRLNFHHWLVSEMPATETFVKLCSVASYGHTRWDALVGVHIRRQHKLLSQAEVGCLMKD